MTFIKGNLGFFIVFLIIGGILGSAMGTLLAKLFPTLSIVKSNLTAPIGFNLEIISFSIRLNLAAIIGMIVGIFIYQRV
ncbi:MAG: hypothetical protein SVZ03_10140 [Spirochaetota bacterium]|nr:hypothetical protein [Spirochaetota bacterium]